MACPQPIKCAWPGDGGSLMRRRSEPSDLMDGLDCLRAFEDTLTLTLMFSRSLLIISPGDERAAAMAPSHSVCDSGGGALPFRVRQQRRCAGRPSPTASDGVGFPERIRWRWWLQAVALPPPQAMALASRRQIRRRRQLPMSDLAASGD